MSHKPPITIRDVALAAGVSPMSVSKVLHGKGSNVRVSEETAEAIRRAATQLDYRPNSVARNFRSRKTATIGLVFDQQPEFTGTIRYFGDILDGVTRAAFEQDYSITLCNRLIGPQSDRDLFDGRFDGLLWIRMSDETRVLHDAARAKVPLVIFHDVNVPASENCSFVSWDNEQATRQVVELLSAFGHRNVLFAINRASQANPEARLRARLFAEACASVTPAIHCHEEVWSDKATELARWLQQHPETTALVAWSESLAVNMLEQCRINGISIPQRLSVVGFDSSIQCELTQPKLTAAHQPIVEMASRAASHLIQRIKNPGEPPQHFVFPSALRVRESVGQSNPPV